MRYRQTVVNRSYKTNFDRVLVNYRGFQENRSEVTTVRPASPTTNNTLFTFGSSRAEVLASQGNPTSTDERTEQKWFYGESWVQFIDTYYGDEVMGWKL